MNAEFKVDQIGTPFVWVGALEGGGRGGGGGKRGSNPKNIRDVQYFFFSTLLARVQISRVKLPGFTLRTFCVEIHGARCLVALSPWQVLMDACVQAHSLSLPKAAKDATSSSAKNAHSRRAA